MSRLDEALLDLCTACYAILPYRPAALQATVRRAVQAVMEAARAEATGAGIDPRERLRCALDQAALALSWQEISAIVNAAGRRHAGPDRRAAG